ncbi:MAG: E3 binding domain-containing protein [Hyphomicrobiaceae bacterium]|nr:E3 binding domain-containing protein [Hyphomicrobiaceae bacterium]
MPVEVILPKVDMDMATGRISRWLVAEGSPVKKGEGLFEIETDKAAMEIEAPADGVLAAVTGREGDELPIGARVALILVEGELSDGKAAQIAPAGTAVDAAPQRVVGTVAPVTAPLLAASLPAAQERPQAASAETGLRATPLARKIARDRAIALEGLQGSGPRGRIQAADVEAALALPQAQSAGPDQKFTPEPCETAPALPSAEAIRLGIRIATAPSEALLEMLQGACVGAGLADIVLLACARALGPDASLTVIRETPEGTTGALVEQAGLAGLRHLAGSGRSGEAPARSGMTLVDASALGLADMTLPLEPGERLVLAVTAAREGMLALTLSVDPKAVTLQEAARLLHAVERALEAPFALLA